MLPLVEISRSQKRETNIAAIDASHPNIQAAAVITRSSLATESLSFRLIEVIAESHVISSDSTAAGENAQFNSVHFIKQVKRPDTYEQHICRAALTISSVSSGASKGPMWPDELSPGEHLECGDDGMISEPTPETSWG